jgi:hypothetical protein
MHLGFCYMVPCRPSRGYGLLGWCGTPTTIHRLTSTRFGVTARACLALNCPDGPVTLIDQSGLRLAEIVEIGEAVADDLVSIYERWSDVHG